MMKTKKFISAFLTLLLLLSALSPFASADIMDYATAAPETTANNILLIDLDSGRELYAVKADERAYPASTTKIMTVLLVTEAIERGEISLEDMVTAEAGFMEGITSDASTADIKEGETMSLRDLMYCAMLPSANEACNILAMYLTGSLEEFVALMNNRAAELGCTNTHFANPSGMPDENHYTTARDLCLISAEALKHDIFKEICGTASYITSATNMSSARELHNSNALICTSSVYGDGYYYEGAYGVKTGRTDAAGLCLVSAAEKGGVNLMCVVLGADEDFDNKIFDSFGDTVKLFDWAFGNFSYRCLLEEGSTVGEIPVTLGDGKDSVELLAAGDVTAFSPMGLTSEHLVTELCLDKESLEAPVKADTVVGTVKVCDEYGTVYGEVEVKTAGDVKLDVGAYLGDYLRSFLYQYRFIIAACLAAIVVLIFTVVLIQNKKRKGKPAKKSNKHSEEKPEKKKSASGKKVKK